MYNHPHIIFENNIEYCLGELNGDTINYDFQKILNYLEAKGKNRFGSHFKIDQEDNEVLYKLCTYAINDKESCNKLGINPNKGLLVSGPVGCGKTTIMELISYLIPLKRRYQLAPSRNIVFKFNNIGYSVIEEYGDNKCFCFDDLGVEPLGRHYGKDCNVIGEILLSRYVFYLENNIKTYATTNLNAQELEEHYGNRVRSRMRQMFNLISFAPNSRDKRV